MSWSVRLGPEDAPMWLTVVDATKGEARFSMEPRRFRSKAYAEAAAKVARKIVESPLEVVPSP